MQQQDDLHDLQLPLRLRWPCLVGQHGLQPLQRRGVLGDIELTKGCFEVGGDRRRPPVDVRIQQRFSVDRWLGVLANHGADPRLDIAAQFVRRGELADQPLVLLDRDGVRFWSADDDALETEAFDDAEDGHLAFGAEPFPVGPRIPVQKDRRLESEDFRLEPEVLAVSNGDGKHQAIVVDPRDLVIVVPAGRRFSGFVDKLPRREVEGTFHHQSIAALEPLADPAGVIARSVDEAKLVG